MKILFLTQILPYPPDAGPRVKTWNVLRYLVRRGHEIHLASFVRPEEQEHLSAMRDLCASVRTVPIQRSRSADLFAWIRSHLSGRPFLVERDGVRAMTELVQRTVAARGIEAIHADQLSMAQFALGVRRLPGIRPRLIFDAHNAVWKIVGRMKAQLPALLGPIIDLEARRIRAYEGRIVRAFDRTLAVSKPDRAALIEAGAFESNGNGSPIGVQSIGRRIAVVPIGVDTEQLTPVTQPRDSTNILMLGTLHYPPNADGVRWFTKEVFMLIRDRVLGSTLTIVGKNPPADIRRLARNGPGAIAVTGYMTDLTPYFEAAAVMVVPVRAGGGMRVRILEGFARGMPMVTTTLGLEGIQAEPGRDILVADSEEKFAVAVSNLLRDKSSRADLSNNGRKLVLDKYDWRTALEPLDQIYNDAPIEAHAV